MTYSIVAFDSETGALGVGVQTHQPCVGSIVPWVEPGVGAIATQSFANINFGPQGLSLLTNGLDAQRTLAALIAGDDLPGRRQVAVIDAAGAPSVHTGVDCIPFASHVVGTHFSTQANMMTNAGVPEAMASAFEGSSGYLAERIMAALEAGQEAGGDIRGSQSAAILVRLPGPRSNAWDLRIDNSARPLQDLRQLVNVRLAGSLLVSLNADASIEEVRERFAQASQLYPSDEQAFWYAINTLPGRGQLPETVEILNELFERAPQWRELLARLRLPGVDAVRDAIRLNPSGG
ncbi:MAG: DUF1028 domain-containing protein [bacterium]